MARELLRFEVFGRRIDVERKGAEWVAYLPGADGKRRLANIPIPSELDARGVARYLDDLFHESASDKYASVTRL